MARTERESDTKRKGRLVGAAETSKERAEWRRLQWKNLNVLGLWKRKEWHRCHREAVGKYAGSAFAKRKRNRAVCPKHQIMRGESRWTRAAPWRERRRSEREHGVERMNSTVKEGKFQGGKGRQAR